MASPRADRIATVATLDDPVRRAIYDFTVAADGPVTRDAVAEALRVSRRIAALHLDRLAEQGLLAVEYRRLHGRTGPGAGRPAKLYRRSPAEVAVSIPDRRYDLIAHVFVTAVAESIESGSAVAGALDGTAYRAGQALGEEAGDLVSALDSVGYHPRPAADGLTLHNCPFHRFAQEHTALVCGVNLELVRGCASGAGTAGYRPVLDPGPDRCCVRLIATPDAG
ncbi:MAG TPA: helix-turn-helix domain-containing protein [Micromonosporaceae bacterium]|nr:helix-turn-helix domain-containing protein [Micromonosporaceae bacterium]